MDAEAAFEQWKEEHKGFEIYYITKKAFLDAFALGAHAEAKLWSQWILSQPKVREYWELVYGGGEFSADDAATMVSGFLNGIAGDTFDA